MGSEGVKVGGGVSWRGKDQFIEMAVGKTCLMLCQNLMSSRL